MIFSYNWLQEYFDEPLPSPDDLAKTITLHSYEVEEVKEKDGDYLLDIDILPNRSSDSLSHDGIAREIGILLGRPVNYKTEDAKTSDSISTEDNVSLSVENHFLVPRATKRLVEEVTIKESPKWLKDKLSLFGQRSINNIVDITNLVMLETGQPVHAFDFDKIKEGTDSKKEIIIRGAKKGEKITLLDGSEYELPEGVLVIADTEKALDIAGIKGGVSSGIDENTKRILLSVCNFSPVQIRKTSRSLGLLTDASKRFEQGLPTDLIRIALERLSYLIDKEVGGSVSDDFIDFYPRRRGTFFTGFSLEKANSLLGTKISEDEAEKLLSRLGFEYQRVNVRERVVSLAKELTGTPYKYGASISMDAPDYFDCSSFVSFVYSRAGLSIPRMTVDQFVFGYEITKDELLLGDVIFSRNSHDSEVIDVELAKSGEHIKKRVGLEESKEFMPGTKLGTVVDHNGIYIGDGKVIHASGKWHKGEVVIEDLDDTPAFENVVGYRRALSGEEERFAVEVPWWRPDVKGEADLIEEVGRVFGYEHVEAKDPKKEEPTELNKDFYWINKIKDILVREGFSEVITYVFRDDGQVEMENPFASDKSKVRDRLRGGISDALKVASKHKDILSNEEADVFEIGKVFNKEGEQIHLAIGSLAAKNVKQAVEVLNEELPVNLDSGVVKEGVFEIDLGPALSDLPDIDSFSDLEETSSSINEFSMPSIYPYILRDIAAWSPDKSKDQRLKIEEIIRGYGGEWLMKMDLFDEFEKEGRTSYAFHLVFQSGEKTLSDDEVNEIMEKIYKELQAQGWEAR